MEINMSLTKNARNRPGIPFLTGLYEKAQRTNNVNQINPANSLLFSDESI